MLSEHAKNIELVRTARKALEALSGADLPEVMAAEMAYLPANVFAQILMEHLTEAKMSAENKAFWLGVAEHMGPDWIAAFRRVGAFMAKVDEF